MFTYTVLFLLFLFLLFVFSRRNRLLPPGEFGLPVVGVLPYMGWNLNNMRRYINKVKGKYGNIFSVQIGTRTLVFLKDYELIKKYFSKNDLTDRPEIFTYSAFGVFSDYGIELNSGPIWEANRRFTIRHLRDLGMEKISKIDTFIFEEAEHILKELDQNLGEPVEIGDSWHISAANVTWRLIVGSPMDPNDKKLQRFHHNFAQDLAAMDGPLNIFTYLPFLEPLLPTFIKNKFLGLDSFLASRKLCFDYLAEIVEEHKKTLDRSNPRDYIDDYFIEIEKNKEFKNLFEDPTWNLVHCVQDLFNDSLASTAVIMKWFMLYMTHFPEVQKKIHEELDSTLSRGQFPSYEDRDRLPYLHATLYEVQRIVSFVPFGMPRGPKEEYEIEGYRIPKNSIIYPCIEECHLSPKYWEKPNEFYPEHFLDENGAFSMRNEAFMPFGIGKRICPGQGVGKIEIFVFAAAVINNYTIRQPENQHVDLTPDESIFIVSFPQPFKLIFEKRK